MPTATKIEHLLRIYKFYFKAKYILRKKAEPKRTNPRVMCFLMFAAMRLAAFKLAAQQRPQTACCRMGPQVFTIDIKVKNMRPNLRYISVLIYFKLLYIKAGKINVAAATTKNILHNGFIRILLDKRL